MERDMNLVTLLVMELILVGNFILFESTETQAAIHRRPILMCVCVEGDIFWWQPRQKDMEEGNFFPAYL